MFVGFASKSWQGKPEGLAGAARRAAQSRARPDPKSHLKERGRNEQGTRKTVAEKELKKEMTFPLWRRNRHSPLCHFLFKTKRAVLPPPPNRAASLFFGHNAQGVRGKKLRGFFPLCPLRGQFFANYFLSVARLRVISRAVARRGREIDNK